MLLCSSMVAISTTGKSFERKKDIIFSPFSTLNRLPKPEDNFVALTSMFAVSSGSIGVDLQDIANQPIRFNASIFDLIGTDFICRSVIG